MTILPLESIPHVSYLKIPTFSALIFQALQQLRILSVYKIQFFDCMFLVCRTRGSGNISLSTYSTLLRVSLVHSN